MKLLINHLKNLRRVKLIDHQASLQVFPAAIFWTVLVKKLKNKQSVSQKLQRSIYVKLIRSQKKIQMKIPILILKKKEKQTLKEQVQNDLSQQLVLQQTFKILMTTLNLNQILILTQNSSPFNQVALYRKDKRKDQRAPERNLKWLTPK